MARYGILYFERNQVWPLGFWTNLHPSGVPMYPFPLVTNPREPFGLSPAVYHTPKMIIQTPKLESFNYLLCVASFLHPSSTHTHIKQGGSNSSSTVSLPSLTLCLNPTMHKDQSLKKSRDNPYYFSLAGNLMHTYKSQQLLLSAADASKWPGATAKEADQTLKCFSASSLVRLCMNPHLRCRL